MIARATSRHVRRASAVAANLGSKDGPPRLALLFWGSDHRAGREPRSPILSGFALRLYRWRLHRDDRTPDSQTKIRNKWQHGRNTNGNRKSSNAVRWGYGRLAFRLPRRLPHVLGTFRMESTSATRRPRGCGPLATRSLRPNEIARLTMSGMSFPCSVKQNGGGSSKLSDFLGNARSNLTRRPNTEHRKLISQAIRPAPGYRKTWRRRPCRSSGWGSWRWRWRDRG